MPCTYAGCATAGNLGRGYDKVPPAPDSGSRQKITSVNRLFTRIYLPEDTEALANDPLLSSLPEDRRRTLIAEREANGDLRFDIRLQGENETVFLSYPGA